MNVRALAAVALVVIATGVCVRLGVWQLARLDAKRALNAARRRAIAAEPLVAGSRAPAFDSLRLRRVRIEGRFDESRQVLLAGRTRAGLPGVHVVTPLRLADSSAVLVDRGWLYSEDAASGRPQDDPEPRVRAVTGLAMAIGTGRGGAWLLLERDSVTLWAARELDRDSIAARYPYAVAPYLVRELPGPGVPNRPLRVEPEPLDEGMHLSYAIQWFSFGAILAIGSLALAWSRRRAAGPRPASAPAPPADGR